MRLLKLLVVIFVFYFVKRFLALYRELNLIKTARNLKEQASNNNSSQRNSAIIDAEFKVIK